MKKIFALCLIGFIFCSCQNKNNKVEHAINGWWTMDTIYYKNYNIRNCLGNTSLFFKFRDKSIFPVAENGCGQVITHSFDPSGDVRVLDSDNKNDTIPFRLKITTENKIFAGEHKIVFYKDMQRHVLKMEIFSDDLYIICHKGLFYFDDNIDLMDDLEKITWTNRAKK
jgi:hypothetical protein